jgi:putative phosphoesterase
MLKLIENLPASQIRVQTDQCCLRIAIIADTHIPDRVNTFHPNLLPSLLNNQIDLILHCGDSTQQSVLSELEGIAPVLAIMGNRDAFFSSLDLPFKLEIEIFGKRVGLYHGYKSIKHYFTDKIDYILHGYAFDHFHTVGQDLFPDADVLCFGHTHFAEIRRYPNQWVINPGSSGPNSMNGGPSWALLEMNQQGRIKASFQPLLGYACKKQQWIVRV